MREYMSSVSPKGQVTLPVGVRRQLGSKGKDRVTIAVRRGDLRVQPNSSPVEASYRAIPALKREKSLEDSVVIAEEEWALATARDDRHA